MLLVFLLIIELILLFMVYEMNKADFVTPATTSIVVFCVATLFAAVGNALWKINFSYKTMLIIISGLLAMAGGEGIARIRFRKKLRLRRNLEYRCEMDRIEIECWKSVLVIGVTVLLTMLYAVDILRKGADLGNMGLGAINAVKRAQNVSTSPILRQGIKVVMASSFVNLYIFCTNIISGKRTKKDFIYLIPAVCACICSVFTAVRTEIFRELVAFISIYYILMQEKRGWKQGATKKILKKVVILMLVASLFFTGLRNIVKDSELATNKLYNTFEYLAYYAGTPIIVLGIKVDEGIENYGSDIWGGYTFYPTYGDLADFGMVDSSKVLSGSVNAMISRDAGITANVDTILGSPLYDFGLVGMMIYIMIVYYIISAYYFKHIKYTEGSVRRNKYLVIYSFIYAIPAMSYYANLAGRFITIYFFITWLLIKIIYDFYFSYKIKLK
ncbi:MAG: oligosaccharide repeat unit polymerase [Lachnoclostridium sp.]|nr:oligosaccharide repeat unit polymerase [Lachnospira sp.]MCM1247218.1 oligosaccharide repeat unit polymerase [Lachnoclostridium sp.]MCM1534561.1 oligosaccharide repeat unit polymerase [Clostridium sp.]